MPPTRAAQASRRLLRRLTGAFTLAVASALHGHGLAQPSAPLSPRIAVIADRMNEHLLGQATNLATGTPEATRELAARALEAAANHPETRAVLEERAFAAAATREARSQWLPQIDSTVDAGKRRASNSQLAEDSIDTQSGMAWGLSLKQLLYDFGATSLGVDASRARERGTEARLVTRRSEQALRAATAWLELERARQLSDLAEDNLSSRSSIVTMVRERVELGGSSRADLVRAQAREADARAVAVAARIELQRAIPAYREAFGSAPGSTDLPADLPLPILQRPLPELARGFGGIRELKAVVEASTADARAANSRSKPAVNLELSGNRRENGVGGGPTEDTVALVVVRYRVFTGFGDDARTEQARRRASQSQEELERLFRQVERSIDQAIAQIEQADALLETRRMAVLSASESLAAVKEQFAFNRGSLLDLLRVQEDLYNSGRDLINARIDRSLARFRLLHLTGELEPRLTEAAQSFNRR